MCINYPVRGFPLLVLLLFFSRSSVMEWLTMNKTELINRILAWIIARTQTTRCCCGRNVFNLLAFVIMICVPDNLIDRVPIDAQQFLPQAKLLPRLLTGRTHETVICRSTALCLEISICRCHRRRPKWYLKMLVKKDNQFSLNWIISYSAHNSRSKE